MPKMEGIATLVLKRSHNLLGHPLHEGFCEIEHVKGDVGQHCKAISHKSRILEGD